MLNKWISYSVISNSHGYFVKIPAFIEYYPGDLTFSFEGLWYLSATPAGLKSEVSHSWKSMIGNAAGESVDYQRPAL